MANKITRLKAIEILKARDDGKTAPELAKEYGVSTFTIYAIWRGDRWGNLPGKQEKTGPERLSDEAVMIIKDQKGKTSPEELAERFGCGTQAIISIWRGYRHK
jgi:Mor family transcriptional regulator